MDDYDIFDLLGDPSAFGLSSGADILQPMPEIFNPGDMSPQMLEQLGLPTSFTLDTPMQLPNISVNGGSSSSLNIPKSPVNGLLSALGISSPLLSALLPLLGTAGAGLLNRSNVNRATDQVVSGLNNASQQAQDILGPFASTTGVYAPFIDAGKQGVQRLSGMNSNIASRYQPLGSGRGMVSLGQLVKGG